MADVTLINIADGVRATWAANAALSAIIPAERLYLDRTPPGTPYPNATMSFKDVSAYFGGTEYFSGSAYRKTTQINVAAFGTREVNWAALAQAISDTFGWTATATGGTLLVDNAVMLAVMPEVEGLEVLPERVDNEDIVKYTATFTAAMTAERG